MAMDVTVELKAEVNISTTIADSGDSGSECGSGS